MDSPLRQPPHTERVQHFNLAMLKSDYLAILATLVLTAFIHIRIRKRSRPTLPPGPKKLPLLGNLFDLPASHEWLTYAKLCKEYGMYQGLEFFIQFLIQRFQRFQYNSSQCSRTRLCYLKFFRRCD